MDLRMTTKARHSLLTTGLLLLSLQGLRCQKISSIGGLQHGGSGNSTAPGSFRLSNVMEPEAELHVQRTVEAKPQNRDVTKKQMKTLINLISELVEDNNKTLINLISELVEDNKDLKSKLADTNKKVDAIYALTASPCSGVNSSDSRPIVTLGDGMTVVCDVETYNGGWVVFQRRASADVDFFRNWTEYQNGFGDMGGNFWLGLDTIHRLTSKSRYELWVEVMYRGETYHAHYDSFRVFGGEQNYIMLVSGYSGTAGDSLVRKHNGRPFSTFDKDNDPYDDGNCAELFQGAWWYNKCHDSNLNGRWNSTAYGRGLTWRTTTTHYNSVAFSQMKMRPFRF